MNFGKAEDGRVTRIGMAPREAGTTYDAFQRHWRSVHADAAGQLPGLLGYTQNHAVLRDGRPLLPYPGFDACSEMLFESLESMDAAFESEVMRTTVQDDEQGFVDKRYFTWIAGARSTVKPGPKRPGDDVKVMTLWRPAPGVAAETLDAALAAAAERRAGREALIRHELIVELDGAHDTRPPAACRVVDVQVFASVEDALADLDADDAHEALRDLAGIGQAVGRHIAREVVVVPAS